MPMTLPIDLSSWWIMQQRAAIVLVRKCDGVTSQQKN